jgi:hypothetical protein
MRGALSMGVLLMLWLYNRGDFKGILKTDHLWAIGQLMLTFTVFWAYISFSQYFLIWNANVTRTCPRRPSGTISASSGTGGT